MFIHSLALTILIVSPSIAHAGLFNLFDSHQETAKKAIPRFPSTVDEKREQYKKLTEQLDHIDKDETAFNDSLHNAISIIDQERSEIKAEREKARPEQLDFFDKAISLYNDIYQMLLNIELTRKEQVIIIKQHLDLLDKLFKDPTFETLTIKPHAYYSYKDLKKLIEKIAATKDKLHHIGLQKDEAQLDLDNVQHSLAGTKKELEEKKKQQEEFSSKQGSTVDDTQKDLTFRQQGQILDLEVKLLTNKVRLLETKILETKSRAAYLDSNSSIEQEKLRIFKNDLNRVRESLKVDTSDIQESQKRFEDAKKEFNTKRDQLMRDIQDLTTQKNLLSKDLDTLKQRHKQTDITINSLGDWSITPQSVDEWVALCDLGFKFDQIQLQEQTISYLNAQTEYEREQLHNIELNGWINKTLYNLTRKKIKTDDELRIELKRYQDAETELRREEARFKDKAVGANNLLALEEKSLNSINALAADLAGKKETLFKQFPNKFKSCETRLKQTQSLIKDQIKTIEARTKAYNSLSAITNSSLQDLRNIIAELEVKSIWQRSEAAISWQGIRNLGTDLQIFIRSVINLGSTFFANLHFSTIGNWLSRNLSSFGAVLLFLLKLLLLLLAYFMGKRYLARFELTFNNYQSDNTLNVILARGVAGFFAFWRVYYFSIFIWLCCLVAIQAELVTDLFLHVLFYLGSIVYLCYLIHAFIVFIIHFNAQQNYILFNPKFEWRFSFIVSLFGYFSVILLLLREAFIVGTYHHSEFPTILMALYTTLVPILIIPSIGKEEFLSLIPTKGMLWKTIGEFINNYYYILLSLTIMIIILSDPRVGGYGNLVTFIFWGVIGTGILLKVLILAQNYLRKSSSTIFFYSEDDTIRERFRYATTWYGLFVIGLFIVFVLIGIIIGLRIWGKIVTWDEIIQTITHTELISAGMDETGKTIWITPYKIVGVIIYIIFGFITSYAINKFVIRRIFQLLPVDLGIQNTVTSLIRYMVIVIAIYLGFQMAGLSTLLFALGLAIGSIAYFNKEPLADFISYFLILVQRPVKIGDYVEIDKSLGYTGVVRQITARSTILRSKNSFSVIVPNSIIVTHTIKNWNYSGVFIALDDIFITIPYSMNPDKIRRIFMEVCDKNTDILRNPPPIIRLNDFGDNGYLFMLRAFVSSTKTILMWDIASNLRFALVKALQKEGISIAFPTRVVISAKSDAEAYHPMVLPAHDDNPETR